MEKKEILWNTLFYIVLKKTKRQKKEKDKLNFSINLDFNTKCILFNINKIFQFYLTLFISK